MTANSVLQSTGLFFVCVKVLERAHVRGLYAWTSASCCCWVISIVKSAVECFCWLLFHSILFYTLVYFTFKFWFYRFKMSFYRCGLISHLFMVFGLSLLFLQITSSGMNLLHMSSAYVFVNLNFIFLSIIFFTLV